MNTNKIVKIIEAGVLLLFLEIDGFCEFTSTGWTMFRKVQSSKFSMNDTVPVGEGSPSGMLYNPATLGKLKRNEVSVVSELGPVGDGFGGVLAGFSFGNMALGIYYAYYDAGIAELNWIEGGELKSRNVNAQRDMLGGISMEAGLLKGVSVGVSVKGAKSVIAEDNSAYAIAGDIGVLVEPSDCVSMSVAYRDFGYSTEFSEDRSDLPTSVLAGCGYNLTSSNNNINLSITAGANYYIKGGETVPAVGVEVGFNSIVFDAGYKYGVDEYSFQTGMRLSIKNTVFAYAYVPGRYFDDTHRMTLSYRFAN